MRDRTKSGDNPSAVIDPGLGNVLFEVWLVSRAVHALIDETIEPTGLDADEFAIYSLLASSATTTPTDLAQWMAAPATTVSSYVKRFEKRGHVKRFANPDDGRSYLIKLTAAGRRIHREAGDLYRPILADVEQRLGRGTDQTHRRLAALHEVVDAVQKRRPEQSGAAR